MIYNRVALVGAFLAASFAFNGVPQTLAQQISAPATVRVVPGTGAEWLGR